MNVETELWQQYQNGLEYQRSMGFRTDFPMYVRFKEGDQWAPPTARTRNLPRPVFNIVEMFIRHKRAAVLNQHVALSYAAEEDDGNHGELAAQGAKDLTDYAKQLWERTDQSGLNRDLLDDAATLGSGVLHYYYDTEVIGNGKVPFVGEIRGESIDPLNIFFGDPQQQDIQKQPYIVIASRRRVREVQEMARRNGVPESMCRQIGRDDAVDEVYDAARVEVRDEDKCTVLTRYYRVNGQVVFDRATRTVELVRRQNLTPPGRRAITMYPVVMMTWRPRKQCIYGIGEAEGIIPNQKAINFNIAMLLLSVQQTAWPKLLSTPGAIRQPVTNEPGEHIIDYSAGGGGIRYLNPPVFGSTAMNLSSAVMELSRTVAGVSEVITGEMGHSNMAASAIIALQTQAKTPIEEIQQRYWNVLKQVGRIWLEFILAYYVFDRPLYVTRNGKQEMRRFNGAKYQDIGFALSVDVGASSEFSEVLSQTTLDNFLANGYITVDQYIELASDNVVPFKERLRQMRAENAAQEQPVRGNPVVPERKKMLNRPAGADGVLLPEIPAAQNAGRREEV
jgi:hypothetical protein